METPRSIVGPDKDRTTVIELSSPSFLAIDLGAESGRGVLGTFDGERVSLTEIGRFVTGGGNDDLCDDGVQRWDFERIFDEIQSLYRTALENMPGRIAGIGVDSWGVDFGLLDRDGNLLAAPVCYRDRAHAPARDALLARIPAEEVWDATGIQPLAFNTLYQIAAMSARDPALLDRADRLLMMPDLLHHRLTGGAHRSVETTNGSTTQMMTPGARSWNRDLLDQAGLPSHFLGDLIGAGTRVGATPDGVPVYTPATHDTASAVVAAPAARSGEWAYLSSGTWSLLGAELDAPAMDRSALRLGFSNEGGVAGTTRFLKNIMGLWLVQQSRRSLRATDRDYTYAELTELAAGAAAGALVDAAAERFLNPPDMVSEIRSAAREAGQREPESAGEIVRCCLESLALAYRRALRDLRTVTGRTVSVLHIVGGGSENALLNQWTADACGIPVLAGPREATALGNVLGQMIGAGLLTNWQEARELSRRSFTPTSYIPTAGAADHWSEREESCTILWEEQNG